MDKKMNKIRVEKQQKLREKLDEKMGKKDSEKIAEKLGKNRFISIFITTLTPNRARRSGH